jgi:hypothetical protein
LDNEGEETLTSLIDKRTPRISFINPIVNDLLTVTLEEYATGISIYNIQGKIEFTEVNIAKSEVLQFDFQTKPAGIYLLRITTRDQVKVYRIARY